MTLYSSINLFFIKLLTILVPRALFPPCAFLTGGLFYLFLPRARRAVRANLRAVTGREDVERLVVTTFYKFSLDWTDIVLMMRFKGRQFDTLIGRRTSSRPLDDALAAGTGAILISPHLGNWELGGLGLAAKGYPINVLTFREHDEKVNELREAARRRQGINFIYVDRDDTSPLAIIEAATCLRRNEVLALLGDRDGSSHTALFDFFGRPAQIPMGAAHLSLATGAPVIPVFVLLEGTRYATVMEEPIFFKASRHDRAGVIREGTERLLRVFERYISAYPDQWYNFYDYWGEKQDPGSGFEVKN
ncbi:MAG TPA: lysophospholipid acyltransferase family protein [Geobacteraceae bacterium]